ncbi:MAG: ankyrin repeat domain-containing protein [Arenicellales bacterium]
MRHLARRYAHFGTLALPHAIGYFSVVPKYPKLRIGIPAIDWDDSRRRFSPTATCPGRPKMSLQWRVGVATLLLALSTGSTAAVSGEPPACNDVRARFQIKQNQLNTRTLNFFLFDAADRGCISVAKELLSRGASIRARDQFGNTAVARAARHGEKQFLEFLLDQGAIVDPTNVRGSTPLLQAVTKNRRRTINLLLQHGANPNAVNKRKVTPLIAAAYNGNFLIVKLLLDAGANIGGVDATGKGALVYAAAKGFSRIVEILLDAGESVDSRYGYSLTALMWASGHTNEVPPSDGAKTVDLLLRRGADLIARDDRGRTALMIAAQRDHKHIVELLLDHGADRTMTDNEGKTAWDLATDPELRALLL